MSDRPRPLDVNLLQSELRALHGRLTLDLVERADQPEIVPTLRDEHERQKKGRRTGEDFTLWRRHFAAQVASAWILSTLFVRVLEDRGLLPRRRLAGEGADGEAARESRDTLAQLAPHLGAREYLLTVFQELMAFPATRALFEPAHNLAWRLGPSEGLARELIAFWEAIDPEQPGRLRFAFDRERASDTRFLGDVYEQLDPDAKKRFALLQTPDFVEKFILDRTLTPALSTFGLGTPDDPIRLIDPACGSGHFLLGAYERLVNAWADAAPAADPRDWAERALRSVAGVDINPYAVAIARFRLTLAALETSKITNLASAPAFPLLVTTTDALRWGGDLTPQSEFGDEGGAWSGRSLFDPENVDEIRQIMQRGRYHVVVGNPPYITPKDKLLNEEYRSRYSTCHMKYALVAPFVQRAFELAVPRGLVGLIVANSFMKREFGKKLIGAFLPNLDLAAVYDTSGAFIPGHGTPTVVLVGRQQAPTKPTVRVAMGKRGEPRKPADPAHGHVWSAISGHGDDVGFENEFVSVTEIDRKKLSQHPWSLGGGGAAELRTTIEGQGAPLSKAIDSIGFMSITAEDDYYVMPPWMLTRAGVPGRPFVVGDSIRDWTLTTSSVAVFPYDVGTRLKALELEPQSSLARSLWPFRTTLRARSMFGQTVEEHGKHWYEHMQLIEARVLARFLISFGEVATHNHFVLDRGGRVFKQTAPVIKLPADATEDDHLRLLGILNSSTIGFWLRQVCHCKGAQGIGEGIKSEQWEQFFQYDGTKLKSVPIGDSTAALPFSRALDALGQEAARAILGDLTPAQRAASDALRQAIAERLTRRRQVQARMFALQEELDWSVYEAYGLLPPGLARVLPLDEIPALRLGQRPFEIALARRVAEDEDFQTAWFERHGSTPTTKIPTDLPQTYQERIALRLELIEQVPAIALIEQPEYKRRWSKDDLEERVRSELRTWLHDRLEQVLGASEGARTVRSLAHELQGDAEVLAVAQVYTDRIDIELEALLGELLDAESVPVLAACRYTATGLEKRAVWEQVWELQRREDKGEKVEIPVPPKYQSKDFLPGVWTHRGKLDVPRERFLAYPFAEGGEDSTALYGWAGWDLVRQARVLADLYERRRTENAWDREQLTPLLASLLELLPWLLQWHDEPDEAFGGERPGSAFKNWLESQRAAQGLSEEDLRAWRPVRGRTRAKAATVAKAIAPEADTSADGADDAAGDAPKPVRPRTTRRAAAAVDPAQVLDKLQASGSLTLTALVEALGAPKSAVQQAADALAAEGRLLVTKRRPITYALAPAGGAVT